MHFPSLERMYSENFVSAFVILQILEPFEERDLLRAFFFVFEIGALFIMIQHFVLSSHENRSSAFLISTIIPLRIIERLLLQLLCYFLMLLQV